MATLFDDINNQTNPAVLAQSGIQTYDVHPALAAVAETEQPAQEQPAEPTETAQALEQLQQPQEQPMAQEAPAPKESTREYNFRVMREKLERAEREAREKEEMLQRLLAQQQTAQPARKQYVAEDDEDYTVSVNPDDIVEGKHLSKIDKKITKQFNTLKQELDYYKQQAAAAAAEARLKSQYRDLDEVLSVDNIKTLQTIYPELARTIDRNPDLYDKAVSAYTMIKNLGIHQSEADQAKTKITQNMAKPRPLAAAKTSQPSESPLSKASVYGNRLSEERKEQLRREMDEAIGGR